MVALVLLIGAVVFAVLRAFGVSARVDFGWLAFACVFAAALLLVPAA